MSVTRLNKELQDMTKTPPLGINAGPVGDNLYKWEGVIIGPKGTPYEGGFFKLSIDFPKEYPFKPPKIKFTTQIYHCNIASSGDICLDILKDQWSPALTIDRVLLSISALLAMPNPDDPLVPGIATLCRDDRATYDQKARAATEKFAQ